MSPEQARGERVDARTDLWSLGVILYEMSTGQRPFARSTSISVLTSIVLDQPAPPAKVWAEVPPELSDLVMRLLEKDPAKRPASAEEVVQALAAIERRLEKSSEPRPLESDRQSGPQTSECELEPAVTMLQTPEPLIGVRGSDKPLSGVGSSDEQTGVRSSVAPRTSSPRRSASGGRWLVAAAVALAVVGPLAWLFGGTIIRIATNQGELVVEVDDPNVEIKVVQNGVVVHDRTKEREFTLTAGQGQIEVFEKDGVGPLAAKQFTLNRGGKTTVRVTLQELADARKPIPPLPPAEEPGVRDPDRRAAEWVLSIGGTIRINDQEQDLHAATELPKEAFRLTYVNLEGNKQLTDAGLAHLKDCKNLTGLSLSGCHQVTDAGLAHLKDLKNLTLINFGHTQVTDAGLAYFKDCKNLTGLDLSSTHVTDAGLAHLKHCKNWAYLNLIDTQVTDAGLAHFTDCKNLAALALGNVHLTDLGLAHFKDCNNLTSLELHGTQLTDAGLVYFKDCKNLSRLDLSSTQATDAGLAHFKNCTNLTYLDLRGTQVTDAGLAQFKHCKSLVGLLLASTRVTDAGLAHFKDCRNLKGLYLDQTRVTDLSLPWIAAQQGGHPFNLANARISRRGYEQLKASQPTWEVIWSERNHDLAQAVLKLGGNVEIAAPGEAEARPVKQADELIRDYFQVRRVSLAGIKEPLDELANLISQLRDPEFDRLVSLDLSGTNLPDLAFLNGVAGLEELVLAHTALDDERLGRLPTLPTLKRLVLDGNDIRGAGLRHLALTQPRLEELSVSCPSIDAAAARELPGFKGLKRLSLTGATLANLTIGPLEDITTLEQLDLRQTKVTKDGIARLQKALPNCQITWDGNTYGPSKSADPDRRAAEWVLSIGGTIRINDQERELRAATELPKEAFRLTDVNLERNKQLTDAGLAHFKDCENLMELTLSFTQVTDAGLGHFKHCKNLTVLDVRGTQVTDAGLAHFKDCENLRVLDVRGTQVTDAGLPTSSTARTWRRCGCGTAPR